MIYEWCIRYFIKFGFSYGEIKVQIYIIKMQKQYQVVNAFLNAECSLEFQILRQTSVKSELCIYLYIIQSCIKSNFGII